MNFEIQTRKQFYNIQTSDNNSIDNLDEPVSYNDFFHNYMLPNKPCIIKNVTNDWECRTKWINNDKQINLSYLRQQYGTCDVTVYNCDERYFNSQKTVSYKFENYIEYCWANRMNNRMYLKDWHLKNSFPDDTFYQVPVYFASDWLNEYLVASGLDDYRFVYMGGVGTWTPFHSDVFNSFSWSVNVWGCKKWIFFPPGEENCLKDSLGNLPYDASAVYKNCDNCMELIQNEGDAVFVPSGWHHQVWNLEDTISVNHNWVNGCNIGKMWTAMSDNLSLVKKEIEDCKDMDDYVRHCQVMLKSAFGMNFYEFYNFLSFIGKKRIEFLQGENDGVLFHGYKIGTNHALYDIQAIVSVTEQFVRHVDVPNLFDPQDNSPIQFLKTIKNISLV